MIGPVIIAILSFWLVLLLVRVVAGVVSKIVLRTPNIPAGLMIVFVVTALALTIASRWAVVP